MRVAAGRFAPGAGPAGAGGSATGRGDGVAIIEAVMDPADLRIRPATLADAAAISAIYNFYVLNSTCTYQEAVESVADRERWLAGHTGDHAVLVAEEADGAIAGWGSLSAFHPRSGFRFTVEDSIYLRDDRRGQGIGRRLLGELMDSARRGGFHAVIAGISAEQAASVALHRRFGFVQVAHMPEVGFKFGRWLDVVYLQASLRDEP